MKAKYKRGEVVQFNEGDKWCGALGFISEVKEYTDDVRYMVGVNIPSNDGTGGIAYRFSMESKKEFERMMVESCGVDEFLVYPPLLPDDFGGEDNE